jgi:hypothetical protein
MVAGHDAPRYPNRQSTTSRNLRRSQLARPLVQGRSPRDARRDDWNLDAKDVTVGKGLHFDVGVGADLGPVAVMLESENVTLFSGGSSSDSVTLDAFAVSARLNARPLSPYVALVVPVDDDLSSILGFMLTAGAEFRL